MIGGGVVGVATARALASAGREVVLFERRARLGAESSARNSGVVHAGIYYAPGSLKARLCVLGRQRIEELAAAGRFPYARVGKLIVAANDDELPALEALEERGRDNGVTDLVRLDAGELWRLEPEVRGVAALHSPSSAILDPEAFVLALRADAEQAGAVMLTGHEVTGIEQVRVGFSVRFRDPKGAEDQVAAAQVVVAAGLDADRVARFLFPPELVPTQHWVKGSWWRLRARHTGRIRRLVYPIPPKGLAGLGIHLTLDLDGALRLGPDVTLPTDRTPDFSVDPAARDRFFAAAHRYLPWLAPDDLSPDTSGFRAKLTRPGEPARDFLVLDGAAHGLPGAVALLGIESPGLTAALALASHVSGLAG